MRSKAFPFVILIILLGLALLTPVGCGRQSGDKKEMAKAEKSAAEAALDGPGQTVQAFLEGVRRGDDETVKAMFTEKARTELARVGQNVAPRASDSTRFEVGQTQFSPADANVAYVPSMRIKTDAATGQPQRDEFVWALRNTPEGWRIAGMAITVEPGKPPEMVNFEDMGPQVAESRGETSTPGGQVDPGPSTALAPDAGARR
jgi:hypothetical protein